MSPTLLPGTVVHSNTIPTCWEAFSYIAITASYKHSKHCLLHTAEWTTAIWYGKNCLRFATAVRGFKHGILRWGGQYSNNLLQHLSVTSTRCVHVKLAAPRSDLFHLIIHSYEYNMLVEGTACHLMFKHFIKLGTMFTTGKILPATSSNSKQKIEFPKKLIGNNAEASRVNRNTLWCLTFPCSRQQTSCYKLVLG